jgi:hypothetical protein
MSPKLYGALAEAIIPFVVGIFLFAKGVSAAQRMKDRGDEPASADAPTTWFERHPNLARGAGIAMIAFEFYMVVENSRR